MSRLYHRQKADLQALTLEEWQESPNYEEYLYELARSVLLDDAAIPGFGKVSADEIYDKAYHATDALDLLASLYAALRRGDDEAKASALAAVDKMLIDEILHKIDCGIGLVFESLKRVWIGELDDA